LIEGFEDGEAGERDTALGAPVLSEVGFSLDKRLKILHMRPAVFGGFLGERRVMLSDIGEMEVIQISV
jgi:hypothetical protein